MEKNKFAITVPSVMGVFVPKKPSNVSSFKEVELSSLEAKQVSGGATSVVQRTELSYNSFMEQQADFLSRGYQIVEDKATQAIVNNSRMVTRSIKLVRAITTSNTTLVEEITTSRTIYFSLVRGSRIC